MMLSHNNEHNGEVCGNAHSEIASSRRGPWGDPVQRAIGRPCAEGHGETLCITHENSKSSTRSCKLIFECPMLF